MDKVYLKSRYDKGEAAYLNCPMTEEEFNAFHEALITAECAPLKEFEKEMYFEGCMPIEVMAARGEKTLIIWTDEASWFRRSENRKTSICSCSTYVKMMQLVHFTILLVSKHI